MLILLRWRADGATRLLPDTLPICPSTHPTPQVPAFVAKRWKACSEQAAERGDAVGRPLATLRFEQGEEGGVPRTTYHLKLDGAHEAPSLEAPCVCA